MMETNHSITAKSLARHFKDGIELYVDERNMVAFSTIRGTARICEENPGTIHRWVSVAEIKVINTEVPTARGIRTVALLGYQDVKKAILKFNLPWLSG